MALLAAPMPTHGCQLPVRPPGAYVIATILPPSPIKGDAARTNAPGGRTGSWQPWVGMGAAKVAMESLCRYFAVALAKRGITVNAISPGWIEDSVLNSLPDAAQDMIRNWHQGDKGWTPMGRLGTPADIGNAV